ncbi:MAG: Gfo/Idh/MocA family protein [Candidatus Hinthialibacter sp.]
MSDHSRRRFLKTAGALSTSLLFCDGAKATPNERLRHAVIGLGGQGGNHCERFSRLTDLCEVAAVCDVDPKRLAEKADRLPNSSRVARYDDYRRILDDDSIDAVSIATPDHWHAKIAVEAILAGKHVYVEKPCSHNFEEGRLLAEAAAKHQKCVQHGTQYRSGADMKDVIRFLQGGVLGRIRMAKAINHQFRGPIGRAPISEPPAGVNYDLWLGPAPAHGFTKNRWHYNWHWFWDYGTGDIGNDGTHQIDVARWGLGVELPNAISASGGQLFYDDDHETPDTQMVVYEYENCHLVYEMRLWTDYKLEGHDNGVVFYGDDGKLEIGRNGCFVTRIGEAPQKIGGGSDFDQNIRNFVECVKTNSPQKLNAPIHEGFLSASLCHFGNIGVRIGRKLWFDSNQMQFLDDQDANELLSRNYREGFEFPSI